MTNDQTIMARPQEERDPTAHGMIVEVLSRVSLSQLQAYLQAQGWERKEPRSESMTAMYSKRDPNEPGNPYVVLLPLMAEEHPDLTMLQEAIERLALVEETMFVTIVCRLLQVEHLVLTPE